MMDHGIVRLHDVVEVEGQEWVVSALGFNQIGLKDPVSDEWLTMTQSAFWERSTRTDLLPRGEDAQFRSDWPSIVYEIREVVTGIPIDHGGAARPEYAPSVRKRAKYESKAAELRLSWQHIQRLCIAYQAGGPQAIVPKSYLRQRGVFDGVDDFTKDVCEKALYDQASKSSTSLRAVAGKVRKTLRDAQAQDDTVQVLGIDQIARILSRLDVGVGVGGKARTRAGQQRAKKVMHRGHFAQFPGDLVEIDAGEANFQVRGAHGELMRPWCLIAVDIATRCIVSALLTVTPNGDAAVELLARAMYPQRYIPSGFSSVDKWHVPSLKLPWVKSLEAATREGSDAWRPVVAINKVMIDNGSEFDNRQVFDFALAANFDVAKAAPYTPTGKAHVERTLGSVQELLDQHMPGHTGKDTSDRGPQVEASDLLDLEEAAHIFDAWTAYVYNNRKIKTLRNPLYPLTGAMSPNQMYAAFAESVDFIPPVLSSRDFISALRREQRTIQSYGVEMGSRRYWSPELKPYVGRPASVEQPQYSVHFQELDPTRVWVYVPDLRDFVECRCSTLYSDVPFLRDVWQGAEEARTTFPPLTENGVADATEDIIDEAKRRKTDNTIVLLADRGRIVSARTAQVRPPDRPIAAEREENDDTWHPQPSPHTPGISRAE